MNTQTKNLILFNGGESEEHEITLTTCQYLKNILNKLPTYKIHEVTISRQGQWSYQGQPCQVGQQKTLQTKESTIPIDGAIPYIHGHPGETGHLLAYLELCKIPYLGPGYEAAALSFNKASTKHWLREASIPVCPSITLRQLGELELAQSFFQQYRPVFVKASSQGSSRGCFFVDDQKQLKMAVQKALALSPYALLEKAIEGRELEVAVYEYRGELHASPPGEIIVPSGKFYSYDEKYAHSSETQTVTMAEHLPEQITQNIKHHALNAFQQLKLRDLARVDFFYSEKDGIICNEINTFPGLTPISMFPKMLEHHGPPFQDWLQDRLEYLLPKPH